MSRFLAILVALALGLPAAAGTAANPSAETFAPGRFMVAPGNSVDRSDWFDWSEGARWSERLSGWHEIAVPPSGNPVTQAAELSERLGVPVLPVRLYELFRDPTSEPYFPSQWSLENAGQTGGIPDADIDAASAWTYTTGTSAVVAVVDSGIEVTDPELVDRLWTNPGEIPANGIDDDGNGLIDDVNGWDFAEWDADPQDEVGHGTAVAAIVAASTGGLGIAGVAPDTRIMAVRACITQCSSLDVADAVYYSALMGADVINLSLGGPGADPALESAVAYATSRDVMVVAAAGNSGADVDADYWTPVGIADPAVIGVASTGHTDSLDWFSNYGTISVDLGAPGSLILVPWLGDEYQDQDGTSFSAPHVAGVGALMRSIDPDISAIEMVGILRDHGDPTAGLSGRTVSGRRLNAFTAVAGARFRDIPSSIYLGDILWLATAGVTKGCNPPANNLFCPDNPVSRGEMAAFLVRALDLPAATGDFFADDDGSVFETDINTLAQSGITKGCSTAGFCPDQAVTRGQMAAFLVRGYQLPGGAANLFTDDDGSLFETDIAALAAAEVTLGCNPPANDRFCPDDLVTRGQMSAFLHRAGD